MSLIRKAILEDSFLLDVEALDIEAVFQQTLDHVVARGLLPSTYHKPILDGLIERERESSTAIGNSVAIPHFYLDAPINQVVVFVRLAKPLNLGAPDGIPTHYLFLLLGPTESRAQHLETLMHIARLMSDDEFRYEAGEARDREELLAAYDRFLTRTVPAAEPPQKAPPADGLTYTGRLAGGILADFRRRWPHYVSDFRDGLSTKCLATVLFLTFACLAPAITFGGVMAIETEGHIGPVEMILALSLCGSLYALLAGQPMIIMGGTGPLLAYTIVLYRLCVDMGVPFLPTYAWVGFWTSLFVIILAVTDASCLMRHFTRFTDEIFAALVSLIYIYEAVKALVHIFTDHEVSYATALLSLLLAMGTFQIATTLVRIRRSRYLLPRMREILADFGPSIALALMTLLAVRLHEVELGALPAPDEFGTTLGRAWLINPFEAPRWVWFASIGPALFGAVLVYLDQNITARIVNNPDHKLQKGESYHLDLAVVGGMVGICSGFGLPWHVAATVRSLNHIHSLATVEEVMTPGGETHERIIHVRENRLTGLFIHLLIGCSLFLLPWLKQIPMAALYGLFLYMGVVSLSGNQFFQRMQLWLMDSALYPSTHYMRRVPTWIIHIYTLLQFACLSMLWLVKSSAVGILFPLLIAVLAPIRIFMGRFFPPEYLAALDGEEEPDEDISRW